MIPRYRTACLITLGLLAVASTGAAQGTQPPPRNTYAVELEKLIAGREQQPAEQVFKNIQTFKGMPAIRVLRIMEQAFVPNLGVNCSHCHDVEHWESDAKRQKGIARGMWAMRASAQDEVRRLTGKADVVVTCFTCHKGQAIPTFAAGR
jgi:hypothetical protein